MVFPFHLPHLLHPPRPYRTIALEHKHRSDYNYLDGIFLGGFLVKPCRASPYREMKAILYQRYKVMLYVTIKQQQVSLEQGPVHVATWWFACLNNRPNWQWKNQAKASGLCSHNMNSVEEAQKDEKEKNARQKVKEQREQDGSQVNRKE